MGFIFQGNYVEAGFCGCLENSIDSLSVSSSLESEIFSKLEFYEFILGHQPILYIA